MFYFLYFKFFILPNCILYLYWVDDGDGDVDGDDGDGDGDGNDDGGDGEDDDAFRSSETSRCVA